MIRLPVNYPVWLLHRLEELRDMKMIMVRVPILNAMVSSHMAALAVLDARKLCPARSLTSKRLSYHIKNFLFTMPFPLSTMTRLIFNLPRCRFNITQRTGVRISGGRCKGLGRMFQMIPIYFEVAPFPFSFIGTRSQRFSENAE